MSGYTKLFGSLIHSTIWREPDHVRVLWVTMLAMVNGDGVVEASVPGLADASRIDVTQCRHALGVLSSPDPDSRTPDFEGRRVEAVDGGWRILNFEKYRDKLSEEDRKTKSAERSRRYRERRKAEEERRVTLPVTPRHAPSRDVTRKRQEEEEEEAKEEAAPEAGGGSQRTALIPCPPDLELTEAQKANIQIGKGIKPGTIAEITVRFRGGYLGKPDVVRTLAQWRAGLNTAVCRDGLAVQRELAERPEGERPKTRAERDAEIAKQNAAVLRED